MKSIVRITIALFAVIAVLGSVSCINDPKQDSKSDVATLTNVKFGDRTATLGAPAAAFANATAGSVELLQSAVTVTATPANNKAALKYAKVAAGAALNEAAFGSSSVVFSFATGDQLAVKVTAEDGETVLYYKIRVTLIEPVLSTLTVGGNTVTPLPAPAASWQSATAVVVAFTYAESEQAAGGLVIAATTQTQGAVIAYGHATGNDTPTFSSDANILFENGEFLYVRVTVAGRSSFYKLQIYFDQIIAQAPVITVQPQGGVKEEYDQVTLSVTANSPDGGSLSYQWYKAVSPADTPEKITGAVSKDYSFSAAGTTTFYQVEVKNTLGYTSATTRSAWVGIVIQDAAGLPDNWVDKVTIKNISAPVYGFNLPAGDTFGNYDRIKFSLKFETAVTNRLMQAWGNYDYNSWTDVYYYPDMGNATPNGLLLNVATQANYAAGTWASYTIQLTNRDALATAAAIKATGGVILLAFAPIPAGGTGTTTFYVKNVTLENAAGTKKVKALNPNDPLLFYTYGAQAHVSTVTPGVIPDVTRVLSYE